MARDFNTYKRLLQALLPIGRAWRSDDPVREELLTAKAVEFVRVDDRMDDLLTESDVRTTTELIGEHEEDFGLPDGCIIPSDLTILERQTALLTKLRSLGRLNKQYYIDLAAALGYTIHIEEYTPAWCGLAEAGDSCGDQQVLFYWLVNVHYDQTDPFIDYETIECLVNKLKPIHTIALFTIWGPGFDNGFSNGFNAMPPAVLTRGGFSTGFSSGFAVFYGGGFEGTAFSDGFDKPYVKFGY